MILRDSILATLRYSDHFNFPLTASELHRRLIKLKVSRTQLDIKLHQMLKNKQISQTGNYFHLPGRKKLVSHRQQKIVSSAPLLSHASELVNKLIRVPGILAVYMTGSVAMQNASATDDIDLMLITRQGKLWTTRLLATLYCELLGVRRHRLATNIASKLCLNLFLTPQGFGLPSTKRSLYSAYELIQAVPLYDPHNTHASLLSANPWIWDYLPNYERPSRVVPSSWVIATSPLIAILELIAYRLQLLYMRPHLTREYITLDAAFFHPQDPGSKVLQKLKL